MAKRKAGIDLTLYGFDELLKEIEKVGGTMNSSVETCMRKSADVVDAELREQLSKATKSNLAERMPKPKIDKEGNQITAFCGFEKGVYDPNNLSDGYKALFLNYGTPNRHTHGAENEEKARDYIGKAKRKAKKKVLLIQEDTLTKILRGLKG